MQLVERILNLTIVRLVLFALVFFLAMRGLILGYETVTGSSESSVEFVVFKIFALFAAYVVAVLLIEWRPVSELSLLKLPVDASVGTLYGFAALSSLITVMYVFGSFHVTGTNESFPFLTILAWVCFLAISEEIMFRGWLYRIFEDRFGTWVGLIVSSVPFGIAHLANPGATWFSTVSIVAAGFWLGILFTASAYRLWVPIFVHIVWNYSQALYGTPVSGTTDFGNYLESNVTGPEWLTGGSFGPEGSYLCLALLVLMFAGGYRFAERRGLIIPLSLKAREIEVIEEVAEEVAEEVVEAAL